MQKVLIITASLFLFSFSANAHGEKRHKNDNESQEQIQNDSLEEASSMQEHGDDAEHVHGEPETHHADATVKGKASFESFPTLHPMIVHFPIVLLLFAALFQIISFFVFKEQLSWVTLGLATAGVLGAYVAGRYVHPHTNGLSETAAWVLDKHEWFADYTLWSAFIAVVLKSISHFFLKRKLWLEIFVAIALISSAYFVSETGHYGAQLIHIEGVGAKGAFLETGAHTH